MKFCPTALALLLLGACGAAAAPANKDPVDLGRRLVSDPRDWRTHAALAELRYDQGVWGESLREYLVLERQEKLNANHQKRLGELLIARAQERLRVADPGALSDLQHAKRLGGDPGRHFGEALALKAAAELRHSSSFRQKQARAHLKALGALSPGDPRVRQAELGLLSSKEVLQVLRWFQDAGAKRQALRVAQHYVDTGGRDLQVLEEWMALHRWWFGGRRPALPSAAAALTQPATPLVQIFERAVAEEAVAPSLGSAAELVRDWELDAWRAELLAIADAYAREPARAETLARQFVDKDVYSAPKLVVIAELYLRLGDRARAKKAALALATTAPESAASQLAAGLASAIDGDLGPADQYFIRAAAASGDPGRYWALAGATLRRAGHRLESIAANRRALALTAPGSDLMLFLEVMYAQRALGRTAQAEKTQEALLARFPENERVAALAILGTAREVEKLRLEKTALFLEPLRAELGL